VTALGSRGEEESIPMPRKRLATQARLQNLKIKQKNSKKVKNYGKFISHPSQIQTTETLLPQTAVLDEPDTLDTDNPPTIPSDDSEGSSVEIIDGGSDLDICEETELARFSRILCDAQKKALAENAERSKRKTYSGQSRTTAHRRKRNRIDLAAKGYLSVHEFMRKMSLKKQTEELNFEESEESSDDEDDDAAIVSGPLNDKPSPLTPSEGTEVDKLTLAVSLSNCHMRGPAASAGHHQATRGPAARGHHQATHGRAASAGHHQAVHGPAANEGYRQVPEDPAASEARHGPAVSGGHRRLAQGPAVNEEHRQPIRCLPEEEEETTESEDENKGNACEDMQDIASKKATHLGPASFEDLRHRVLMESADPSPISSDGTPAFLCDRPRLHAARAKLAVEADNKVHDLVTRRRIQKMLGLLNLYLDDGLTLSWRKTSVLISKAQGHGKAHARRICEWAVRFLQTDALPSHCLGQARWTVLSDEDIASEIKSRIVEKSKEGFVKAEDVVDLVASREMQVTFSEKGICKPSISKRTATRWLQKLDWRYQKTRNGMYIDGHEREDVVAYRCAFVERWKTFEKRFHQWDNDGRELPRPNGFPLPDNGPFRLVLITHDESTFYQNDRRKIAWAQTTSRPVPQPKGDGQSIMVSDFLTSEWGCLHDGKEFVRLHLSPILSLT
jgi:hypothetical protein